MLVIEAVANTMIVLVVVTFGLRWLNTVLHRLVEMNLARVAAVEARHLDDEWRRMAGE